MDEDIKDCEACEDGCRMSGLNNLNFNHCKKGCNGEIEMYLKTRGNVQSKFNL